MAGRGLRARADAELLHLDTAEQILMLMRNGAQRLIAGDARKTSWKASSASIVASTSPAAAARSNRALRSSIATMCSALSRGQPSSTARTLSVRTISSDSRAATSSSGATRVALCGFVCTRPSSRSRASALRMGSFDVWKVGSDLGILQHRAGGQTPSHDVPTQREVDLVPQQLPIRAHPANLTC